jgi:hypothetical protein
MYLAGDILNDLNGSRKNPDFKDLLQIIYTQKIEIRPYKACNNREKGIMMSKHFDDTVKIRYNVSRNVDRLQLPQGFGPC